MRGLRSLPASSSERTSRWRLAAGSSGGAAETDVVFMCPTLAAIAAPGWRDTSGGENTAAVASRASAACCAAVIPARLKAKIAWWARTALSPRLSSPWSARARSSRPAAANAPTRSAQHGPGSLIAAASACMSKPIEAMGRSRWSSPGRSIPGRRSDTLAHTSPISNQSRPADRIIVLTSSTARSLGPARGGPGCPASASAARLSAQNSWWATVMAACPPNAATSGSYIPGVHPAIAPAVVSASRISASRAAAASSPPATRSRRFPPLRRKW